MHLKSKSRSGFQELGCQALKEFAAYNAESRLVANTMSHCVQAAARLLDTGQHAGRGDMGGIVFCVFMLLHSRCGISADMKGI